MIKKIFNFKFIIFTQRNIQSGKNNYQKGMTYVELIVVLAIFSIITSVSFFNYGKFEQKVNMKVLASDVALKIVQAQKDSLSGKWDITAGSNWKPSYGIHFNLSSNNKSFIYFADLNNDSFFEGSSNCSRECLNKITITKGNSISKLEIIGAGCPSLFNKVYNLNIVFRRPNSGAIITSIPTLVCNISYAQITLISSSSSSSSFPITAKIKVYSSGRIQVE